MWATFRQFLAAVIVTIGVFSLGGVLSWTSPAMPSILGNSSTLGNISAEDVSWISSSATLGAMAASPFAGIAVDNMGRKNTMLFLALPFTLGWLIIGWSTGVTMLCAGRFLTGMCGGGFSVAAPVYISEIADDSIRGVLASFFQLMLVIGILFTDIVGTYVTWEELAFVLSTGPIFVLILLFALPESPRALVCQKRIHEARASLYWFRGIPISTIDKATEKELALIENSASARTCSSWKEIMKPQMRKPIIICLSLVVFKSPVIIFYAFNIFRSTGSTIDYNKATWIVAGVQVVATILSSLLVDRLGRRVLLILSEAVMALSLLALGTYYHLREIGNLGQVLGWLPLVSLAFFIISFSVGAGPLSWVIQRICSAIATTFVWLLSFVITSSYKTMTDTIGCDGAFWFFAGICFLGTIVVILFVPETKGKSLEEIQTYFA